MIKILKRGILVRKKYFRRNKYNIILLIFLILVTVAAYYFNFIEATTVDRNFHLSILTINSIFAGFLFTNLGIMVSMSDRERISKLDKAGYMDNYYNSIFIGLFFHVVSICISLIIIILPGFGENLFLIQAGQICLIYGIAFFIKSLLNVLRIINKVRE